MQKTDFEKKVKQIFEADDLNMGRLLYYSKSEYSKRHPYDLVVFNSNVITEEHGKIWFGDLNLTLEGDALKKIAKELGVTLYVLREMDARFGSENRRISHLIKKAVWNSK